MKREDAIAILKHKVLACLRGTEWDEALEMAIKALEQEPKTGEWIEHFDESGKWYECDQCHTDWGGAVNFCPNCGADMRGSTVRKGNPIEGNNESYNCENWIP